MRFWSIKNNRKIDIIIIDEKSIYKGRIKAEELSNFSKRLDQGNLPKDFFEIPFSYIKRIEYQENKKDIKIFYGDSSEEEFTSPKEKQRDEIFNHLKEVIPNMSYSKDLPSLFKYAKPQLFAILFTSVIFLWSLYYAIQIESGVEYELIGRPGVLSLIFSIGLLGVLKVILIFILLISLELYFLFRKNKTRSKIEQLNRF